MNTSSDFVLPLIEKVYRKESQNNGKFRYLDLYRAIKSCIEQQDIPYNWQLPSTRVLSKYLSMSRTTVNTAYELLLLEKRIVAKAGSGFRVQDIPSKKTEKNPVENAPPDFPGLSLLGKSVLSNVSILNRAPDVGIAFKPGMPPVDIFPINRWKNLLNSYWRHVRSSDLTYGQMAAEGHLKEQICNFLYVSRAIRVHPDQVIVVSGSLQSLYFIASALIDPGDKVILENPTFPNVISIFKSFRADITAVNTDKEGIDIRALRQLNPDSTPPKLIHVTPSNHYPFGIKMSQERRLDIIRMASENRTLIIENDYEHEMANSGERLPTLFSLDKEQRTIYLGTFNRLLYPSIRLGFMLLPPRLVKVMKAFEEHTYRFVSPSLQMVMSQFIEKNYLYQHLKNLKEVAKERLEVFKENFTGMENELWLDSSQINSLHIVANCRQDRDIQFERRLVDELAKKEIAAFPLSNCYLSEEKRYGLILGYSTVRPTVIRQKLSVFKEVMNLLNSV